METQTKEPVKPAEFQLAAPRKRVKVGLPTDELILFTGLPKSAKTTLTASIPGLVLLETEKGGADRVDGWVQEIPNMAIFRKAFMAAVKNPAVKGIGVDVLDDVLEWITEEVAAKYQLSSISERKEGVNGFAVRDEVNKQVEKLIAGFKNCGKMVVMCAHFKEPKLDTEGRLVITTAINAPSGKIGSFILGKADVIGHCFKRQAGSNTEYIVSFLGGGVAGTFGSRIKELENKQVVLPETYPWGAIEALFAPKEAK